MHCLLTAPNAVDSSASVFTSLPPGDRLVAPYGRNPWLLTPSRICPPLSLDQSQSQSYITADGQSVSLSWCQVASEVQDQIFVTVRQLRVCSCGAISLTR
jgi:hypothetical protein